MNAITSVATAITTCKAANGKASREKTCLNPMLQAPEFMIRLGTADARRFKTPTAGPSSEFLPMKYFFQRSSSKWVAEVFLGLGISHCYDGHRTVLRGNLKQIVHLLIVEIPDPARCET